MSERIKRLFLPFFAVLVLIGCGKQHKAETTVKDFLETNIEAEDYTVDFKKIDSTMYITDSIINRMRSSANQNKFFKKDLKYGRTQARSKYIFIPANIYIGKDTVLHTFYLDMNASYVIAFK